MVLYMGNYLAPPCIIIETYTEDHIPMNKLTVYGLLGNRKVSYVDAKIPHGKILQLPEAVYQRLLRLIDECGMHNFDNEEQFGDSPVPTPYMKMEVDTKTGRKKIHAADSYPVILSTFARNASIIALGLNKELISGIPYKRNGLKDALRALN